VTEEQLSLLAKARDSLRGARMLAEGRIYDFAVSRAYYAMFYVAKAFLVGKGLTHSKHSSVIAAFGQHFAKAGLVPQEFHDFLIKGQDLRNVGDYRWDRVVTQEEAATQMDRAEKFLGLAERLIGPIPPLDEPQP